MSVIVTLHMQGDPDKVEAAAKQEADRLSRIIAAAQEAGVISHRFYGSDDGRIMILDEWPDGESFHSFFGGAADDVGPVMEAAGIASQPEITVWRKLDTGDEIG